MDPDRCLPWELHAHCLSLKNGLKRLCMLVVVVPLPLILAHDCMRLLICGMAGLQKGTSDSPSGAGQGSCQLLR